MGIRQTNEELKAHFEEQIQFLELSADAFDHGYSGEAKRLAATLRVLFHDTAFSVSLLKQLGRKKGFLLNTALPVEGNSVASQSGLVLISATNDSAEYIAPLDGAIIGTDNWLEFEEWWKTVVFVDQEKKTLTRRELVLKLANEDGGSHVSPELTKKYAELSRKNSLGWVLSDGKKTIALKGPERAAVRQITHEVLKSLIPRYSKAGPDSPKGGIIFGGAELFLNSTIEDVKRNSESSKLLAKRKKIGRNAPCPCGSRIKYKKCHGALS